MFYKVASEAIYEKGGGEVVQKKMGKIQVKKKRMLFRTFKLWNKEYSQNDEAKVCHLLG